MSLLASVLRERGPLAFEDPSLWVFRRIAEAAGARLTGVPVYDEGLRVSELDSPAVVVTPAHQYPLGMTLAPRRRAELTRWASEQGGLVIEDDYDGEFRFDRKPVGALQALAPERVAYAGTASKTLAPRPAARLARAAARARGARARRADGARLAHSGTGAARAGRAPATTTGTSAAAAARSAARAGTGC
ncbi:hypothetical protein JHE00_17125 [Prauserella sp. ASG 168]|uniref:Aminotransferase class I/classII domain-containing protein n=1 Tax=Prauserella cavernicola TaxID=2800127 RepID=A0A934QSX5_9PSEU|nr:hypothetical protein [Prauserella cavernicola]